mmetsp:Transcript_11015/g.29598  ORF Transcript_11015/g.29598 Transcript_11015/m.29598 type:complete len:301 (-) Transcript_11015:1005-1907(-)
MAFVAGAGEVLRVNRQPAKAGGRCAAPMKMSAATAENARRQHVFSQQFYQNLNAMSAIVEARNKGEKKVEPSPFWTRPVAPRNARALNEVSPLPAAFSMARAEQMLAKDEISPAVLAWVNSTRKSAAQIAHKESVDFVPSAVPAVSTVRASAPKRAPVPAAVLAASTAAPAVGSSQAGENATEEPEKPVMINVSVPKAAPAKPAVEAVPVLASSDAQSEKKAKAKPSPLSSTVAAITSSVVSVASPRQQDPKWSEMTSPVVSQPKSASSTKSTRSPIESFTRYVMRSLFGRHETPATDAA